ncbi:MAG: AAA family ATPase, partial [Pseudomonadota bacterium]|nr:AAA family ATPase [Pseudomonadota bacterium]
MFYDLVGSTALAGRCDPEDFSDAVETFHRRVAAAVEAFGGFVGARVGDGAVVYFGYPEAQEDAAERAVLAALQAVAAGAEVVLPDGNNAAVRVGVATGQGIVRRLGDGNAGNEVMGPVANLAARLEGVAAPGAVVIGGATQSLVRGLFEVEDLGPVEVKGFAAPVQAWRVLGVTEASRFLALHTTDEEPIVGRDAEFAVLEAAWRDTLEGRSRVVLLTGEPGIGKSSFAAEFVKRLQGEDVFRGNVSFAPHSGQDPLRPFIKRLRRADGRTDAAALESALAPGTDEEDAALLAGLLGVPAEAPEA